MKHPRVHPLPAAALAAVLTLVPAVAAQAAPPLDRIDQAFLQLDKDCDGSISRAEFERGAQISAVSIPAPIALTPVPFPPFLLPFPQQAANPNAPAASTLASNSYQPASTVRAANPYLPATSASASNPYAPAPNLIPRAPFEALDLDRNGYLTSVEVLRYDPLVRAWYEADRNHNGLIERAEFSAFETEQR